MKLILLGLIAMAITQTDPGVLVADDLVAVINADIATLAAPVIAVGEPHEGKTLSVARRYRPVFKNADVTDRIYISLMPGLSGERELLTRGGSKELLPIGLAIEARVKDQDNNDHIDPLIALAERIADLCEFKRDGFDEIEEVRRLTNSDATWSGDTRIRARYSPRELRQNIFFQMRDIFFRVTQT